MTTQKTVSTVLVPIAFIGGLGFFAVIVFWPAGRIDWIDGWIYLGLLTATLSINLVYIWRENPELIAHRLRLGKGTKLWDKIWAVFFAPVFLSIYVIAGFDAVRFEWSTMSSWLWLLGLALWLPGNILFTWSMGVNPFFEKTVRIQAERGHRVIDVGPYSFVRHPGYLGFFGWCLSAPLLLGSWWTFVPALLSIFGIVIRTTLEDRMLREELIGYGEYARRVRYRLIPRIW